MIIKEEKRQQVLCFKRRLYIIQYKGCANQTWVLEQEGERQGKSVLHGQLSIHQVTWVEKRSEVVCCCVVVAVAGAAGEGRAVPEEEDVVPGVGAGAAGLTVATLSRFMIAEKSMLEEEVVEAVFGGWVGKRPAADAGAGGGISGLNPRPPPEPRPAPIICCCICCICCCIAGCCIMFF
jgi:hypothetical protein